jgi:hypothetical protein
VPVKDRHFQHQGQKVSGIRALHGAVGVRHWNDLWYRDGEGPPARGMHGGLDQH